MISIIPEPSKITFFNDYFILNKQIKIVENNHFPNSISFLKEYLSLGISEKGNIIFKEDINLKDEEYKLIISKEEITICSKDDIGAFYGVQSLRQIIDIKVEKDKDYLDISIPTLEIFDSPKMKYRGFLLDVARHFFSVSDVKKVIDYMSMFKFNHMHFHISDDQGFRLDLKKYPKIKDISTKRTGSQIEGLFGKRIKVDNVLHEGYYTEEDIDELLSYAKSRCIKIIPEIDLPGHLVALLSAYPEFTCEKKNIEVRNRWGISKEVLCIGNPESLDFIYGIIKEVVSIFKTDIIHIGGDECPTTSYAKCPKCIEYMKKNGIKKVNELEGHFIDKLSTKLFNDGLKVRVWNEAIHNNMNKNIEVQYWSSKDMNKIYNGIKAGNKFIISPYMGYYLDLFYELVSLKRSYNFDPYFKSILGEEYKDNILGVECCLWTEWVETINRIEFQLFPRSLVVSEVGWNGSKRKDFDYFLNKLENINKRFDLLGINYSPKELYMKEYKGNKVIHMFKIAFSKVFPSSLDYKKYSKKI